MFRIIPFSFSQVINAALTLAARPQSKVAQDNMDVFKDQWEKQVRILTEAVDDITSVDDFLSVSGKMEADCYIPLFCEINVEYFLSSGEQEIKQPFCIHTIETLYGFKSILCLDFFVFCLFFECECPSSLS